MANNDGEKYQLYKLASWMREHYDYNPQEGLIPENVLTQQFQASARLYAAGLYNVEIIKKIGQLASSHTALAADMLGHFSRLGQEATRAGDICQQTATEQLAMIQQGDGPSAASPSHYQLR